MSRKTHQQRHGHCRASLHQSEPAGRPIRTTAAGAGSGRSRAEAAPWFTGNMSLQAPVQRPSPGDHAALEYEGSAPCLTFAWCSLELAQECLCRLERFWQSIGGCTRINAYIKKTYIRSYVTRRPVYAYILFAHMSQYAGCPKSDPNLGRHWGRPQSLEPCFVMHAHAEKPALRAAAATKFRG